MTFDHKPGEEKNLNRGGDIAPKILVGDIEVDERFHYYMMKATAANPPATQAPLFQLPAKAPKDIGSDPGAKSKHHKSKDKKDNERTNPTIKVK